MTKKKSDDYGLSNGSSDASLDAALTECINNIADIPPDRVVNDVYKQLMLKFQPGQFFIRLYFLTIHMPWTEFGVNFVHMNSQKEEK